MCKGYTETTKCNSCNSKVSWDIITRPCRDRCAEVKDHTTTQKFETDYCDSKECKRIVREIVAMIFERTEREKDKILERYELKKEEHRKRKREAQARDAEVKHELRHGGKRRHSR